MWQIFDNSKIRDKIVTIANDHEFFYVLLSLCLLKTANYANVADIRKFDYS